MASQSFLVFAAFPTQPLNRALARRTAVAVLVPDLSGPTRLSLLMGQLDEGAIQDQLPELADAIAATADQLLTPFIEVSSQNAFLGGPLRLADYHWARLQAFIPLSPEGFTYFRIDEESGVLLESNMPSLQAEAGEGFTWNEALERAGFELFHENRQIA